MTIPDQNQTDNRPIPQAKPLDEFQEKFLSLPTPVQDWMCSFEAAENTGKITRKFNLPEDANPIIARITGDIILKDVSLDALPALLQKNLQVDDNLARQIAIEIALKQFLVLRNHLRGVEDSIKQLGGLLPTTLPPLAKTSSLASVPITPITPAPTIVITQKSLRQLVKDNKDALNQNLTNAPIKITDFDQPVRPTIKNWLVDYVKIKGAGHHESLERSDYLFNNANARVLPEKEQALLAEILRAYDDDTSLPVNESTQTILLDKLTAPKTNTPKIASTAPRAAPRDDSPANKDFYKAPNAPTLTAPPTQNTNYREPISQEDLSGPLNKQTPSRPAPRLSGNVIDLSNISSD